MDRTEITSSANPERSGRKATTRVLATLVLLLLPIGSAGAALVPESSLPNPIGGLPSSISSSRGRALPRVPIEVDGSTHEVLRLPRIIGVSREGPTSSPTNPLTHYADGDPVFGRFHVSSRISDQFEGERLELEKDHLLRSPLTVDEIHVGFDLGAFFTGLIQMDSVAQEEHRVRVGWDDWINLSFRVSSTRTARYDPESQERTWREDEKASFHLRKFRGVVLDGRWHHQSQSGPAFPRDALWDDQEAALALSTHAPALDGRFEAWGGRFADGEDRGNRVGRSGFVFDGEREFGERAQLRLHYDYREARLEELDLSLSDTHASLVASSRNSFGFHGLDLRSHLQIHQRKESFVVNAERDQTIDAGLRFDYRHDCGATLSGGIRERQQEGWHLARQAIEKLIVNPDSPRAELETLRIDDSPHMSEVFLRGRIDHQRILRLNMELLERNHYGLPRTDLVASGSESLYFADRRRMRTRVDLFPRARTTASVTKSWDLTRNVPWVGAPQIEQQVYDSHYLLLWHVMKNWDLQLQWSDFDLRTTDVSVQSPDGHRYDAFTGYSSFALRKHVELFTEFNRYATDAEGSQRQSVFYVGVKTRPGDGKAAWRLALGRDIFDDRSSPDRSYGADLLNVSTEFAF